MDVTQAFEAFASQLQSAEPLTASYFEMGESDRQALSEMFNQPVSDQEWEKHCNARLVTSFGTRKQVGDRLLFGLRIVCTSNPNYARLQGVTLVERELAWVYERYHVTAGKIMPTLIGKQA